MLRIKTDIHRLLRFQAAMTTHKEKKVMLIVT